MKRNECVRLKKLGEGRQKGSGIHLLEKRMYVPCGCTRVAWPLGLTTPAAGKAGWVCAQLGTCLRPVQAANKYSVRKEFLMRTIGEIVRQVKTMIQNWGIISQRYDVSSFLPQRFTGGKAPFSLINA